MRYLVCHGAMLKNVTFDAGRTRIGFYVSELGLLLLKQESVSILVKALPPTLWLKPAAAQDFRLTPLQGYERHGVEQAIGTAAERGDILFLDRPMTLSEVARSLPEGVTELRMIACTVLEGTPVGPTREEVLPGIFVDHPGQQASRNAESLEIDHQIRQLHFKRQKSAAQAGAYIGELGAKAAPFRVASDVSAALMVEWEVGRAPAVASDPRSWLDTLYWVQTQRPAAQSLCTGQHSKVYPGYGDDLRARLGAINRFAATWPDCVGRFGTAWAPEADQKMVLVRDYLQNPIGADAAAVVHSTQRFLTRYLPVWRSAQAVTPSDPDTWHAYLGLLGLLTSEERPLVEPLVKTAEYPPVMATWAAARGDGFPAFWQHTNLHHAATVAPVLRAAATGNPALKRLIEAYEAAESSYTAALARATGPVFADGLDIAPPDTLAAPRTPLNAAAPRVHCFACEHQTPHAPLPEGQVDSRHRGVRLCRGCGQGIGYDPMAAFACARCGTVVLFHRSCLAS